ncbi:MAG TPA: hypothetical protein VLZ83_04025 [Edaphocola sp.]|nr:hypothetical protein [Edaphocola sp.]
MVGIEFEEEMKEHERNFIKNYVVGYNSGYYKFLKLLLLLSLILTTFVGLVGTFSPIENPLQEPFDPFVYIPIAISVILLLFGLVIFAEKVYTYNFKRDLKHNLKLVVVVDIKEKLYVPLNKSFYFQVNYQKVKSIEVSYEDYKLFEVGDLIHIEFTKYSKTYLGYY